MNWKNVTLLRPLLVLCGLLFWANTAQSHELKLWYDRPANIWEEALPLGNGRIGAMVYGGVTQETIQLNEDTFWAGGPHNNLNPAAKAALPEIRRLIAEGKHSEASALAEKTITSQGANGMPYQTAGFLDIQFPGHQNFSDYYRDLNLQTATAHTRYTVSGNRFYRDVFVSFVDQVVVVRLKAEQPGTLTFSLGMSHPETAQLQVNDNALTMRVTSSDHEGIKGQVQLVNKVQVVAQDGKLSTHKQRLVVQDATQAVILVSLGTNFVNYQDVSGDELARAEKTLQAAAEKFARAVQDESVFALRHAEHKAFHQQYFNRVSLSLGEDTFAKEPTDQRIQAFAQRHDPALAALYFQFGRYLLITSSQPGTQPANLQGIWNPHSQPPWDSKYTLNINAQMNYWPSEITNLAELHEPFFRLIRELSESGQETAKTMYGAKGWVAHHNTDIWRSSGAVDWSWGSWPVSNAWLVQHYWQHYLHSGDIRFLREVYPILKSACEFFEDFLIRDEKTGWLIVSPSMSPENEPVATGVKIAAGATMDNQLLFDLFTHTMKAAEILQQDRADIRRWKKIVAQLPPMQIGQYHQVQEWLHDWDNPLDQHRHVSHLYGLYPSNQISPIRTPELFSAAKVSMEQRGDPSTGWSMNWKINLWARLLDGDRALKLIRDQIKLVKANGFSEEGGTYPNMFDAHPPFQIDGNFGFTAGIAEMLVQSHDGAVHVLPALPNAWFSGEVKGLVVRGGFEVDMQWEKGSVTYLKIHSRLGGNLRIRSYAPLPFAQNFRVKKAKGQNSNPLFALPQVARPLKHTSRNLPYINLSNASEVDVATEAGKTYIWQASKLKNRK